MPTIAARQDPEPINGWSRTSVTVSFDCVDNVQLASCSSPTTFSVEGAGQSVIGTAVDTAGNQAQLQATVNLDFSSPVLDVTSPTNGMVTTSATLQLTGYVVDLLSGLSSVSCNNVAATVDGGNLSCNVPLRPGRNVVVVAARDLAGNSASAGVTVTLVGTVTQVSLTPSERTMLVGESITLSLRDNFGVASVNATWQTSDAQIVSLSTDDPPVLTALAAGVATISASKNGFASASQVTVIAGDTLPAGTTRWKLPTTMSTQSMRMAPVYTRRVHVNGPDLFTVEPNFSTDELHRPRDIRRRRRALERSVTRAAVDG